MSKTANPTEIQWDFGTAYEFFISLHVLHDPEYYGIRPSYAAGVRSRIPAAERKLLEDVNHFIGVPIQWLHNLPTPKDAISALWTMKQIPAAKRMIKLLRVDEPCQYNDPADQEKHERYNEIMLRVASQGKWELEDIAYFQKTHGKKSGLKKENIEGFLDRWSRPEELGEGFLSALQAYYQAFFEEEEKRIKPVLETGLEHAQSLASSMSMEELFFELSQGVQFSDEFKAKKYILAPAFWTTPLVFFERFNPDTLMIIFGARPAEMSVIPGETLPDGLVRSLKALADPTRLKILYYLSHDDLSPSELARRLHLRAPTVTHHLNELRLASLVNMNIDGQDRKYTARHEAIQSTFANLQDFLKMQSE